MNENELKKRTKQFGLRVIKLVEALPNTTTARTIGNQLLRSGMSVGANYREAFRSRSRAEFLAKVGDCLKEIEETNYWLELLVDGGIVSETRLSSLRQESNELTAIFVAISKTLRSSQNWKQAILLPNS